MYCECANFLKIFFASGCICNNLLCAVGNGFESERWLKGLKYLIHDARHASYLLQVER